MAKSPKIRKPTTESVEYEPCIVAFIDVLGFRDLVNSRSAADVQDAISALQHFTTPDNEELSKSDRRLFSQAQARSVSDAVVRIRPYVTEYRDGALIHEILDLLKAQIELVKLRVLVRGGLTVGEARVGSSDRDPVFGPAMIRAYDIESKEALFPRIVVDDEALFRHRTEPQLRSYDSSSLDDEVKLLSELLATADDGTRYIDYLRATGEFADEPDLYFAFLRSHAELIRSGRSEHTGRRAILRKYEWLARYHNQRINELQEGECSSKNRIQNFRKKYDIHPGDFFGKLKI